MDIFDQPEQEMPHAVNVTPEEQEAIQRVHRHTHTFLITIIKTCKAFFSSLLTVALNLFDQLEAMGFDRAIVIEAFLACDRNEELAANYLLEHSADFED